MVTSSDGIQNFKNRFSFVSNSLTTVSVLGFKVLRAGSKLGCSLKKKRSSFRIVHYTLNKHLQRIETVTVNTEILKYIDYVKLKAGLLNVLKFQERVCANPCKPPESHHWLQGLFYVSIIWLHGLYNPFFVKARYFFVSLNESYKAIYKLD